MAYRSIPLTLGKVTIVDEADYDWLIQRNWRIMVTKWGKSYVVTKIKGQTTYLHRFIINAPKGIQVDHINGDTLNNCRNNLRLATASQNLMNQRKTRGTSKYKGVCWNKKARKWLAKIKINSKEIYLGEFVNEIEAALAYNKAANRIFGEFAKPNII